jgi:hypothetical protein
VAAGDTSRLDRVRVTVTLAGDDLGAARAVFGLTEPTARRGRLHFCEAPTGGRQLTLYDAGLVLRLWEAGAGDRAAVVVLRPARPDRLPGCWVGPPRAPGVRLVGEWTPEDEVVAVTVRAVPPWAALRTAVLTSRVPPSAFSPGQRRFLAECSPVPARLGRLRALGPVEVLSWSRVVQDLPVAAELWRVGVPAPPLLELSVSAAPSDAALLRPALLGALRGHGLDPVTWPAGAERRTLAALTGAGRG